ncbi:MAG: hypothetical protein ACRDMV_08175 [Streptosporangiales bacterium]
MSEDSTLDTTGSNPEVNEADAAEQRRDASTGESQASYSRPLPENVDPADAWDQDQEVQHDEDDEYR